MNILITFPVAFCPNQVSALNEIAAPKGISLNDQILEAIDYYLQMEGE